MVSHVARSTVCGNPPPTLIFFQTLRRVRCDVTHVTSRTRLSLFSRVYVEKIGEPGDEANKKIVSVGRQK